MALHPADFARKGSRLLVEIRSRFRQHGDDKKKLISLIKIYDPQINKLFNERKNWTRRDYMMKTIESFIIGSILGIFCCLSVFVLLDFLEINTLKVIYIVQIYIVTALIGGGVNAYYHGPKDLSEEEKQDRILAELYASGKFLIQHYNTIKMRYELAHTHVEKMEQIAQRKEEKKRLREEAKREKEKKKKGGLLPRHFEAQAMAKASEEASQMGIDLGRNIPELPDPSRKKKKTFFGLSLSEREDRASMLSYRFLMKIAKLKDGDEDENGEAADTRPIVLLIDSNPEIIGTLSEYLNQAFRLFTATEVEAGLNYAFSEKPNVIITEANFPDVKPFSVISELKMLDAENKTPIIIYSENGSIEYMKEARSLNVVDYWIKNRDDDDNYSLDKEKVVDRINFILSHSSDTLYRLFERKIMKKEIERKKSSISEVMNRPKVMIASKDTRMVALLNQELTNRKIIPIIINNMQGIFGKIVSQKPNIFIVDENIAEEHIFNICKMLNVRTRFLKIFLILSKDMDLESNHKSQGLKIAKKYSRPFDYYEILRDSIDLLKSKSGRRI